MEKAIAALNQVMTAQTTDKTVRAVAIWNKLKRQPKKDRAKLLEHVLCNYGLFETDHTELDNQGLDKQLWNSLCNEIGKEVDAKALQIIKSRVSTSKMCENFLEYISGQKSSKRRIFVFARLLHEDFIPLLSDEERKGAVTLTDEEWETLRSKLAAQCQLIFKIKTSNFSRWQEMASAILYQLEQVETIQEKACLMVTALNPFVPTNDGQKDFPGIVELSEEKIKSYSALYREKASTLQKLMDTNFFGQRTERAGAIISFILGHEDRDFQIVLLSQVLRIIADQSPLPRDLGDLFKLGLMRHMLGRVEKIGPIKDKCFTCEKKSCPAHPNYEG